MPSNIFSRFACIAVSCLGVTCGISAVNAAYIIDDFTVIEGPGPFWQMTLDSLGDDDTVDFVAAFPDNVVGGKRKTTLTAIHIGVDGFDFVRATLAPTPGIFDYASTSNAGGHVSFYYDGANPDFKTDLSEKSGIIINFTKFDYANEAALPVTITLGDKSTTVSKTLSLGADELDLFFDLDEFAGINLSEITSIQVDFEPGIGTDFRLAQIAVLPTPGAAALLAIGGLLGGTRRRRSTSN